MYNQPFSRYKVVENRKCTELHQNAINHLTVTSTVYTMHTHPPCQNFTQFRSRTSYFRDTLVENRKCTEWPHDNLNHLPVKSYLYKPQRTKYHSVSLYSRSFSGGFWFPHRLQWWWWIRKFVKNQKLKISKIQNSTFVRPIEKKIQKKIEDWSKLIWRRSRVLKFLLPYGPMLTKTKNIRIFF